tara:strand:+ start:618 stop:779 length:162 start_codon:yes stop_codon:yes gene_type:complete
MDEVLAALVAADLASEDLADLVREMYIELQGSDEHREWVDNVEETFEKWELSL